VVYVLHKCVFVCYINECLCKDGLCGVCMCCMNVCLCKDEQVRSLTADILTKLIFTSRDGIFTILILQ